VFLNQIYFVVSISSSVQRLVAYRRGFRELLDKGHGLLPGGLPGSSGYLGREVYMAVSGKVCRNERRKNL
jgi:hypothetical protein